MKASELSVGDWVKALNYHDDGSPYIGQVDGIIKKHGTYYCVFGVREITVEIDKCEPIPITAEILVKNNFKWDGMYAYLEIDDTSFVTWYKHEGIVRKHYEHRENKGIETIFQSSPGIVYVHQLQHTLRLCGIEKEIEI